MGNSDAMFRQLMSDLRDRLHTHWSDGPSNPDDDTGRMVLPIGPKRPVQFQVPSQEPKFNRFEQTLEPVPEPPRDLSRSGGYAPQEPSADELLAQRELVDKANRTIRLERLSPFQRQRLEMRQYRVAPADPVARDNLMLREYLQQHSSASGGFAPQETVSVPDWKARLEDLERRARELKGDYRVDAPAGMKKPPKGDLI